MWNETFDMSVTNCHLNLKFTIKDKDLISSDLIGMGSLTPSVFTAEMIPEAFQIKKKDKVTGMIWLSGEWLGGKILE